MKGSYVSFWRWETCVYSLSRGANTRVDASLLNAWRGMRVRVLLGERRGGGRDSYIEMGAAEGISI